MPKRDRQAQAGVDRSTKLRVFFARYMAAKGSAGDPRIEQAFAAVPREPFAGPGPWFIQVPSGDYLQTPDDDPAFLYQDTLVALDHDRGINIGEPGLHARCLDALALQEGETVLHIGAGTGYYTAILAHLVGPGGWVWAYEIEPSLAARAKRNLAPLSWVEVRAGSGITQDLPTADAVYVNAGITQPSWVWLDALRPGGRLSFPLHSVGGFGGMLQVKRPRAGAVWPARFVSPAGFIACEGRQDDGTGRRLAAAFAGGGWRAVSSLHLDGVPDQTCWFAGDDWWLSTAAIGEPSSPAS